MSAVALIREYVARVNDDLGDDDAPYALHVAVDQAVHTFEFEAIGRAIVARYNALADASYREGQPNCDPGIQAIADALGYHV